MYNKHKKNGIFAEFPNIYFLCALSNRLEDSLHSIYIMMNYAIIEEL